MHRELKQSTGCEFGSVGLDLKAVSDDGEIEGYASLFGQLDQGRDIVLPGAFTETLQKRPTKRVRMLYQHDAGEPIGVWSELAEDRRGLKARGRILLETARGKEVHALIKGGAIDGLSIGFRTAMSKFDSKQNARLLERVDLWEVSVVTFPLLETARITAVKSFDPREMEGALREAGLSRADAVKAVGVLRKSLRGDAGEPEEGQRDAAADLLANLERLRDKMRG